MPFEIGSRFRITRDAPLNKFYCGREYTVLSIGYGNAIQTEGMSADGKDNVPLSFHISYCEPVVEEKSKLSDGSYWCACGNITTHISRCCCDCRVVK